jgi:hypothetical protein
MEKNPVYIKKILNVLPPISDHHDLVRTVDAYEPQDSRMKTGKRSGSEWEKILYEMTNGEKSGTKGKKKSKILSMFINTFLYN